MYRLSVIFISSLTMLALFSGCAKKNMPVEDAAPAEPITVNEPAKVEEPAPMAPKTPVPPAAEKDPLVDAGLFALDSNDLTTVFFDYDSYLLSADMMVILEQNADMLKADPTYVLRIEGHCDERGSDEYNLSLGELRAQSVRTYLASLGVDMDRVSIISFGEEFPSVKGKGELAWAKNRRVEFN